MGEREDPEWVPIEYREFWDVPRLFWITRIEDDALLFDCPFSDKLDDYADSYDVYAVPSRDLPERDAPWTQTEGSRPLGRVPVKEVEFDQSRRRAIHRSSVARFASAEVPPLAVLIPPLGRLGGTTLGKGPAISGALSCPGVV